MQRPNTTEELATPGTAAPQWIEWLLTPEGRSTPAVGTGTAVGWHFQPSPCLGIVLAKSHLLTISGVATSHER